MSTKSGTPGKRVRLTSISVVDAAARLVDHEGLPLSLKRLADEVGVQTPSLYTHIDSLEHLEQLLKLRGLVGWTEAMRRAATGRAGPDALIAIADAERAFAKEHPGLFQLGSRVTPDDGPEVEQAARELLDVVLAVMSGFGLRGEDALHAARALHAATRGFITLEISGSFGMPHDVDESWRRMIELFNRGLAPRI